MGMTVGTESHTPRLQTAEVDPSQFMGWKPETRVSVPPEAQGGPLRPLPALGSQASLQPLLRGHVAACFPCLLLQDRGGWV